MIGRALLALAALCALSGCQLSPIYAGGGSGAVAAALRNVDVAPIENRSGWLVRQALIDRLGTPEGTASYRIEVELDDQIEGFGIRLDDAITRERRTLRARYRLVSADNGQVRSEEHTSELQSLMRISYAVFCLQKTIQH